MATNEASFVASSVNVEVEGDITVPGAPDADDGPSTLDEPVIETLVSFLNNPYPVLMRWIFLTFNCMFQKRDLKLVGRKFLHVLVPRQSKSLLRDCKYLL